MIALLLYLHTADSVDPPRLSKNIKEPLTTTNYANELQLFCF